MASREINVPKVVLLIALMRCGSMLRKCLHNTPSEVYMLNTGFSSAYLNPVTCRFVQFQLGSIHHASHPYSKEECAVLLECLGSRIWGIREKSVPSQI